MADYQHLTPIYHTNPDILEIQFHSNSRAAVDEYIQMILEYANSLREEDKLDTPLYMIIDVSKSGMYSLSYGTAQITKIIPQLRDLPTTYAVYFADATQDKFMVEQLQYFPSTRSKDTRRVYSSHQREEAIEWLISNK